MYAQVRGSERGGSTLPPTSPAKAAAEQPHLHVDTVRYRLGRVAEYSGCDLRSVSDAIELLIAVRFARAESSSNA